MPCIQAYYSEKKHTIPKSRYTTYNLLAEWKVEVVLSLEHQEKIISTAHHGIGNNKLSQAVAGHFGRDKLYNMLSQCYQMPLLYDHVRMLIKYCEACQKNNTRRLEKSTQKMQSIPVPKSSWAQIGMD